MARNSLTAVETAFANYTLGKVLGQGGTGRVFAAVDQDSLPWAVKLLDPDKATPERRRRFQNEILFSERTRHPNVVRVIDRGVVELRAGTAPFYVMPQYTCSLREVMPNLGDQAHRLGYFDQVLSGVEAAHLDNVFHRDLKPENVLFDQNTDTLIVADFGIAHFTDEELYTAVETRNDDRLANFQYAAPEQRMRRARVDHRADIHALGSMLNELFTGTIPLGTGYSKIAGKYPDLAWLDNVVEAMLRQNPDERPQSIDAVKSMLISYRQDDVIRQRLDEVSRTVVPVSEVTDPLAQAPPQIVDFDWASGRLTLILDREVNQKWISVFQNPSWNYRSVGNVGPTAFGFSGNRAIVNASEPQAQLVINHFKDWLPEVTSAYRRRREREAHEAERVEHARLQAERDELERRQRLRESLKI